MSQNRPTPPMPSRKAPASSRLISPAALMLGLLSYQPAMAQEVIVITDGQIVTDPIVLDEAGDELTVDAGGVVDVDADNADAIRSNEDNVTVINNGEITVAGENFTDGVDLDGSDGTVINNGTITANGSGVEAIEINGGVVINNGTLNATSGGILAVDGQADVTNDGVINAGFVGIVADGDFSTVLNSGTIMSEDRGISLEDGDAITLDNSGTIIAVDIGVESEAGEGRQITNSGLIDAGSIGIDSDSTDERIENIGTILSDDEGVLSQGDSVQITNSGLIEASNDGIFSNGDTAQITNTGLIESEASGIDSDGLGAIIRNAGTLLAEQNGVDTDGADAQIINTGTIIAGNNGIGSEGLNIQITNTGTIIAARNAIDLGTAGAAVTNTGVLNAADGFAILGGFGDQTVTLGKGSQILGGVDLSGGQDVLNIADDYDLGQSSFLSFDNVETLNIGDGVNAFVATEGATTRVQTLDITGPAVLGEATAVLTDQAHRGVDTDTNGAWASLIGAARSRGDDGKVLAHDHRFAGALAGYNLDLGGNRLGLVAGFSSSQIETDEDSTSIDSESVFAGAYLTRPVGNVALTAGLLAGVESHDSDRDVLDNLVGAETATATFDSQFISASVAAELVAFTLGALELRPSAIAAYTVSSFDGYTEEGTTNANLQFDSRTAQTLTTRAQLETVTALANVDLAYRFGVDGRFSNDDDIAITLADQSQDFAAGDSDTVLGGFLGAQARFAPADGLQLIGDVEYGFADGEEQTLSASLNVSFAF